MWCKQKEQKNSYVTQDFIDISISGDGWRDFVSRNLPQNFNYGNIYHYHVESINKVCFHDDYDDEEHGDKDKCIGEVTSKPLKKGTCPHKKINRCLTDINRCLTDISQF